MKRCLVWSDLNIKERLGVGAAGEVWLAVLTRPFQTLDAGSRLAVKRYKSWVLEQPGQFERISRELEVGRTIAHPNLVQTLAVLPDTDGRPVLVMPYYDGESLEVFLNKKRNKGDLPDFSFAMTLLGEIGGALGALHSHGVVHRDLKPANVMLTSRGSVLMDLGVVRVPGRPEVTSTGAFLGTIRYAAPEYLLGKVYDQRADLYSFGCVAYECFSGKLFLGDETHWARLIALKKDPHSYTGPAKWFPPTLQEQLRTFPLPYQQLEMKYGRKITFVAKSVLETTLCDPEHRVLSFRSLADAVAGEIWNGDFNFQDGVFQKGLGNHIFPFLDDTESGEILALDAIVRRLKRTLSDHDFDYLRTLLSMHFWEYWFERRSLSKLQGLLAANAIGHWRGFGDSEAVLFEPAVKQAYLNELL